ncbi:hypothetical protein FQN57_000805 [Myotisia sp. PD_48]|nr:hypothetical protein FQN57_000805 [Myotisia sp. PD_48]
MPTTPTLKHEVLELGYGDNVDTDEAMDDIEEHCESWAKYSNPSSPAYDFYPVSIAELMGERYRIEHRLGWAGLEKLMDNEMYMQTKVLPSLKDTSHFLVSQDIFSVPGIDENRHDIFVFPMVGPRLDSVDYPVKDMPMAARMCAALQLLQALECLHNAGNVHNDVAPGNVMWGLKPFDATDTATKYQYFGRPKKFIFQCWKDADFVKPLHFPRNFIKTDKIYLGDFGLATKSRSERPWGGHVILTVPHKRPFPEEWEGWTEQRQIFRATFDESLYDQNRPLKPEYSLQALIKQLRPEISSDELADIVSKVFIQVPEDRLTATELLHDKAFQKIVKRYYP